MPDRSDQPRSQRWRRSSAAELYLDLLKKCLTRYLFGEGHVPVVPQRGTLKHLLFRPVRSWLAAKDMEVIRHAPFDQQVRAEGRDWPAEAESMAGLRRLDNLQDLVTGGLRRHRAAGVGGGLLPGPTQARPGTVAAEAGDEHRTREQLAVPLEEVKANFARYGLLDERVRFLPGWFKDILLTAPIERLAVLRLDRRLVAALLAGALALRALEEGDGAAHVGGVDGHQLPAVVAPVVQDLLGVVGQQGDGGVLPLGHGAHSGSSAVVWRAEATG
jgi:O-methyltransferase